MIEPTERQETAIRHPPGPLLIIAGAGTGKTTTLILRIQNWIATGRAEPDTIVVVTYTERAAAELEERIEDQLGKRGEGIVISTFHSLCRRLVAEYRPSPDAAKPLILENDIMFLLLDRYDDLDMLTSQMFKSDPVGAVTGSFIPFFNRIRDELLMPEEVAGLSEKLNLSEETVPDQFPGLSDKTEPQEYLRQFHDLVKVYETYQSWKKDLGVVDYSDMVVACWEMLSNDKEVLEKVRQRFRHIVVDEYQDNNYALNQVMGLLAGDRADITVVGDEDQCIYTFRGANYYNVHDFKRRYGVSPGNGEIWLEENHRSTQEILDLANATMEADSYRTPKKLISAWGRRGPKPVWHVGNRKQALEEIPILVDQLVDKGYGYGEVAVLCRTWNQARNVAGSLERAFIPVDIPEEHFFDTGLVKDVLAWGNLLYDHTRANDALFRLLSRYLGRSFAEEFFRSQEASTVPERLARLSSLAESETVDGRRKETLSWILNTLSSLKRKVKQRRRADEMIWEILEAADLLKATRHSYRHPERLALAAAGRLLSMAEEFVAREGGSDGELDRWLRYMDVLSLGPSPPPLPSEGVQKPNPLAVKVMTIHASKGLEFPVVIIPFLESGSLPLRYTPSPRIDVLPESWYRWVRPRDMGPREEHINEERRIFFVGLTRARDEVHLFGPEKRQSLFMKEILERKDETVEVRIMPKRPSTPTHPPAGGPNLKQRILVALNRELSHGQYDYALELIEGLRSLEEKGKLPDGFPHVPSIEQPEESSREPSRPEIPAIDLGREVVLSASSAEVYDRCPYRYRLKEIDRVPERKSKAQMEFGIIIHRVLEEFHSADPEQWRLDFLLSLLDKHWRSQGFEYAIREEEFRRQGTQMLTDYSRYVEANRPEVVAREARFDFQVDEAKIRVTGKIDRIDREGDALSVTDYKTGRNREKAKSSLQLALYTEALRRNAVAGITGKPGTARLHFLRFPEEPVESHIFSSRELQKHLETMEQVADGIRRQEFPTRKGWHCRFCDYRDFLCPAWEEG